MFIFAVEIFKDGKWQLYLDAINRSTAMIYVESATMQGYRARIYNRYIHTIIYISDPISSPDVPEICCP